MPLRNLRAKAKNSRTRLNSYSYLKAIRHPDVVKAIGDGVPARLPHVELILADLCQQACKFCAYRLKDYASNQLFDERRMMGAAKALEIVNDCAEMGVKAIQFTGGGEPTLHPSFEQVFRAVTDLGMKSALVSNGVKITPKLAESIVQASWVRISLDAATEETYVSTRRVHRSHWEKAQQAVRNLREARDRLKTDCVIGVGFVVTPDNWRDVLDAAKLARELGADNFRISAQFSNEDAALFDGFRDEAKHLTQQAEWVSGITVYNRFIDRLNDLTSGHPEDALCGYQFFTTYIGADLNVYRCCGYAYNNRGLMGSLKEQSFKDFWMSQARFDEQKAFDARGCERCQFRKINEFLVYALKPQLHEEFV